MKTVIAMKPANEKGRDVVRAALIRAKGEIQGYPSDDLAAELYGADSAPVRLAKAAVAGGRYSDVGSTERSVAEFFAAVREQSVLGRMRFRRVGMHIRTLFASTPLVASWTRQGDAVPVGRTRWTDDELEPLHVAALTVATRESVEAALGGDPLAEQGIRSDMVRALAEAIDATLLDPANGGIADKTPKSITNGATSIMAGGSAVADIKALVENFTGDLSTSAFACRPEVAAALAGADFPDLSLTGGSLWGVPVAVSRRAPEDSLVLADGAGIALAEGDIGITTSQQASIEMDSTPSMSSDSPTESAVVSLWQTNSVGFLADLTVNWRKVRPASVVMLTGVAYRPPVT